MTWTTALGCALIGAVVLAAPARLPGQEASFPVRISSEVDPRMTAGEAAQKAVSSLERGGFQTLVVDPETGEARTVPPTPEVLRVDCIPGAKFGEVIEGGPADIGWDTVWVVGVRARMSKSTPGGGSIHRDTGYIVIDDATGRTVARGAPLP